MNLTCKLYEAELRKEIMELNAAYYDELRNLLPKRCHECDYVVASERAYELPDIGVVCGLCFFMHHALCSDKLKNVNYFRNFHKQWKELQTPEAQKKRRDKLGI